MKKARLKKLAQVLRDIPPEKFDMRFWGSHNGEETLDEAVAEGHVTPGRAVSRKALTECGMAACAIGHACTMPMFNKLGLRAVVKGEFADEPEDEGASPMLVPTYKGYDSWDAVEKFFGLTEPQARILFDAENYEGDLESIDPGDIPPSRVAKRIEAMVR